MIADQLAARGIEPEVADAFSKVPREKFVSSDLEEFAYADRPLPLSEGQTISQPYVVALTIRELQVGPEDRVLEVGAGSGYAAAVLSRLVRRVVTIERIPVLAETAHQRLAALGYNNVRVVTGDGSLGFAEEAPYDAIAVAAAAPEVPASLKSQLRIGGRLVIPVGRREEQSLLVVTRTGTDSYSEESLGKVRFVPLLGSVGWPHEQSKSSDS